MRHLLRFLLLTLALNAHGSAAEQNFNLSYKTVVLDLNPASTPRETVAVVNKRDENGVSRSFSKYVLFGVDRDEYFNVGSVVLGGEPVLVLGQELRLNYVYDVYTYWKKTEILVVAFRFYYSGSSSYYRYYKRNDKLWLEVDGRDFDQNGYGLLSTENLTKLLNVVELENPRPAPTAAPSEPQRDESRKYTLIIVSAVIIALLALLLVGLAFYFFK